MDTNDQDTVSTKDTVQDTISRWLESAPENSGVKVWCYSPNGGEGGPMGEECWASEDWVNDLLADDDWDTAALRDGEHGPILELSATPERSVHQYVHIWYEPSPEQGRERVAYLGAHAGYCAETDHGSEALEAMLRWVRWEDGLLEPVGLSSCEDWDNGDDGGYWLVQDEDTYKIAKAVFLAIDRLNEHIGIDIDDGEVIYDAARAALGLPSIETE